MRLFPKASTVASKFHAVVGIVVPISDKIFCCSCCCYCKTKAFITFANSSILLWSQYQKMIFPFQVSPLLSAKFNFSLVLSCNVLCHIHCKFKFLSSLMRHGKSSQLPTQRQSRRYIITVNKRKFKYLVKVYLFNKEFIYVITPHSV